MPVALNLKGLYHLLIKSVIPLSSKNQESVDELVGRAERIQSLQKEAQRLETRMNSEKQFNRRVELHTPWVI